MNSCLLIRGARTPASTSISLLLTKGEKGYDVSAMGNTRQLRPKTNCRQIEAAGLVVAPAFVDLYGFPDLGGTTRGLKEQSIIAASSGVGLACDAASPPEVLARHSASLPLPLLRYAPLYGEDPIGYATKMNADALIGEVKAIPDAQLLALMQGAKEKDLPMILLPTHAAFGGDLRAGQGASYYKVRGEEDVGEELATARILLLASAAGCRVHIPYCSTAGTVRQVRSAKKAGLGVTLGVLPFHFAFDDSEALLLGTSAKIAPPLPTKSSHAEILSGIADGTIDCISSGHLPLPMQTKSKSMDKAAFGGASYEVLLGAGILFLVRSGVISLERLIHMMTEAPGAIVGKKTTLAVGERGDLVLFDPSKRWEFGASVGSSYPSPFKGMVLRGRVEKSLIGTTWYENK